MDMVFGQTIYNLILNFDLQSVAHLVANNENDSVKSVSNRRESLSMFDCVAKAKEVAKVSFFLIFTIYYYYSTVTIVNIIID